MKNKTEYYFTFNLKCIPKLLVIATIIRIIGSDNGGKYGKLIPSWQDHDTTKYGVTKEEAEIQLIDSFFNELNSSCELAPPEYYYESVRPYIKEFTETGKLYFIARGGIL